MEIGNGKMNDSNIVVLKAVNITKHFGPIQALRGVNIELKKGEILGLVGDNGAGKTTFLKIVAGIYPPTSGELYVFGKKLKFKSPRDAVRMGIYMVHQEQELALVPQLTAAENFFLGRLPVKSFLGGLIKFVDWNTLEKEAEKLLRSLGYLFDVPKEAKTLSGGERQILAVLRAFSVKPKILLLDESTTALSEKARRSVFHLLKEYISTTQNSAIYVTHVLDDAIKICDRIAILKHGKIIYEFKTNENISKEDIIRRLWEEE